MKSLEQDAIQAQIMIQNINEMADDIAESTSKNEVIYFNYNKSMKKHFYKLLT